MQHIRIGILVLILWIHTIVSLRISKIGTRGDEEEESSSKISAITVSNSIAEAGKIFEYGLVAEINKVKTVGKVKKVGFFMKKFPFLKHLPKLAGTFGALGTVLSIAFSFIPTGESPEMKLMKKEFSELNRKLDIITNSLDESKKLIKEYSQKSAYIKAEHKIIQAYTQLDTLVASLMNVSCVSETDCKYKKMKMVDSRRDVLDVRGEVEMILRGAAQNSVFGTSLLSLMSETSGCYITKIKIFKSAVAALAIKGSLAVALFDMTSTNKYDMTAGVRQFQALMFDLEKKTEDIIMKCFENIDEYIISDTIDLDQKLSGSSITDANKYILKYLGWKYSWIDFYVITTDIDSKPFFWSNDSFHKEMNSKTESENKQTKNYILIGSKSRVENDLKKEARFREKILKTKLHYTSWFQIKYDEAIGRLLDVVQYDRYLHNQFRTITVVPEFNSSVVSYIEKDTIKQINLKEYDKISKRDLFVYNQCKHLHCQTKYQAVAIVATIHSKDRRITDCTKTCDFHGTCFFLPHTKTMACKCDADYYGDDCSFSVSETNMALDLINLIDISFKLPSVFDVSTQLGDVRSALQADLNDIQNSIQAVDDRLTILFDTLRTDLILTLDFYGLLTQYGKIIRDLKYYNDILIGTDDTTDGPSHKTIPIYERNLNLQVRERIELAKKIVHPTELRRSLEYLKFLFIGRRDVSLISHRPLLFLIMDKHRSKVCTSEYKQILDKAYIQLATLEFEGYFLWMHALKLLHEDTSFVVDRYNKAVERHEKFFESNICKVKISNSINFEDCTNGYYMHSGIKEHVKCKDKFYLTNESVSLYAYKVVGVSSQLSRIFSSADEIIGSPDVYPLYGNNSKAWSPYTCNNQFIEVAFKDPLFIEDIMIYETYNAGHVRRIDGLDNNEEWKVINQVSEQAMTKKSTARILKIHQKLAWSTSVIRIKIDCTKTYRLPQIDAVQIKGKPVEGTCSWYDAFSCAACGCDSVGAISSTCSAEGQCKCKSGYRNKRCRSRDCKIGHWTPWSSCECGPGKTRTRTRPITQKRAGSGRACAKTSQTTACNTKCPCKQHERGDNCEHKDCLVTGWGTWSSCPAQCYSLNCKGDQFRYKERSRHRQVESGKVNNGTDCPNLSQTKLCKKPICVQLQNITKKLERRRASNNLKRIKLLLKNKACR